MDNNNFESFEEFLSQDKGFQLLQKIDAHNKVLQEKYEKLKTVVKDLKLTKTYYDLYKSAVTDYIKCIGEEKELWLEFRKHVEYDQIPLHEDLVMFEPFIEKLNNSSLNGIDEEIEKLDSDLNVTLEVVYGVSKLFKDTRNKLRAAGPIVQNMVKLFPPENMDITVLDIEFDNEKREGI